VTSNPAITTANIILDDVISIDAGSVANGGTVNFEYKTTADYNADKSLAVPNSLKVISSTNFDVKVKAGGASFKDSGTNTIPVGVMQLSVSNISKIGGTSAPISLTSEDQVLATNLTASNQATPVAVDITYTIPTAKAKADIFGKPKGTYSQTVTYTATTR